MRALSARYWEQWNRRSATSPRDSELQGPNTSQTLSPWLLLLLPLTALQIFKEAKYKFPNDSYNDLVYATTNENTKGKQTQTQNNSLKIPWKRCINKSNKTHEQIKWNPNKPAKKSNKTNRKTEVERNKPQIAERLREEIVVSCGGGAIWEVLGNGVKMENRAIWVERFLAAAGWCWEW